MAGGSSSSPRLKESSLSCRAILTMAFRVCAAFENCLVPPTAPDGSCGRRLLSGELEPTWWGSEASARTPGQEGKRAGSGGIDIGCTGSHVRTCAWYIHTCVHFWVYKYVCMYIYISYIYMYTYVFLKVYVLRGRDRDRERGRDRHRERGARDREKERGGPEIDRVCQREREGGRIYILYTTIRMSASLAFSGCMQPLQSRWLVLGLCIAVVRAYRLMWRILLGHASQDLYEGCGSSVSNVDLSCQDLLRVRS